MADPKDLLRKSIQIDPAGAKFGTASAAELQGRRFAPIRWVVPQVLPEGAMLLAGRPKIGKSWMALDIGLAVARGGFTLGERKCQEGDVLYLALEDNERRLQSRITKLLGISTPWPDRFHFATDWPRAHEGGVAKIEDWLKAHPDARLIVIDVLQAFRAPQSSRANPYAGDYAAIRGVQELAGKHHVAVLIVHHLRKGGGDGDPFEMISGTMGLSGAADGALVLNRETNGTTLVGRGRDMPEVDYAVAFDREACRWTIEGDSQDVRVTAERAAVMTLLGDSGDALSPKAIADALGKKHGNIRQLLTKMAADGQVVKAGTGLYTVPQMGGIQ